MIKILKVNKQNGRIVSYTCTDGTDKKELSKKQVAQLIDKKKVENATKQVYNGTLIIRVDANRTNSSKKAEKPAAKVSQHPVKDTQAAKAKSAAASTKKVAINESTLRKIAETTFRGLGVDEGGRDTAKNIVATDATWEDSVISFRYELPEGGLMNYKDTECWLDVTYFSKEYNQGKASIWVAMSDRKTDRFVYGSAVDVTTDLTQEGIAKMVKKFVKKLEPKVRFIL